MRVIRLVLLAVSVPTVSNDVDENVLFEFLFVGNCHLHASVQQVRLIGVYVNYRCPDDLSNLCAVKRGSTLPGRCREPQLIVHHDMNHPTSCVIYQTLELKRLIHTALPSDRCIPMNQYSHGLGPGVIFHEFLNSPDWTIHQWIHSLQMRRVGQHSHVNLVAFVIFAI